MGLSDFRDAWPRQLSGGMRKRVALATVLAAGADVLLMDEPFGSVDYFTRRTLHDLVLKLWAETGKTVLFVTHDIEEALILADRILVMSAGRLIDDFNVGLVDRGPRTYEPARRLLRSVNGFSSLSVWSWLTCHLTHRVSNRRLQVSGERFLKLAGCDVSGSGLPHASPLSLAGRSQRTPCHAAR